jgi:hypothetical protein
MTDFEMITHYLTKMLEAKPEEKRIYFDVLRVLSSNYLEKLENMEKTLVSQKKLVETILRRSSK